MKHLISNFRNAAICFQIKTNSLTDTNQIFQLVTIEICSTHFILVILPKFEFCYFCGDVISFVILAGQARFENDI